MFMYNTVQVKPKQKREIFKMAVADYIVVPAVGFEEIDAILGEG